MRGVRGRDRTPERIAREVVEARTAAQSAGRGSAAGCLGPLMGAALSTLVPIIAPHIVPIALGAAAPPFLFAAVARALSRASLIKPFVFVQVLALGLFTACTYGMAGPELGDPADETERFYTWLIVLWPASIAGALLGHLLGSEIAQRQSQRPGSPSLAPEVMRLVGEAEQALATATHGWTSSSLEWSGRGSLELDLDAAVMERHGYRLVSVVRESVLHRAGRAALFVVGVVLSVLLNGDMALGSAPAIRQTYARVEPEA